MEISQILSRVDHTLLKPTASWEEIKALCDQACALGTASACIPPAYVGQVRRLYGDALTICTVIGFPLGYSVTAAKLAEARQAVADGADELDMVVNICDVKNGGYDKVTAEISALKKEAGGRILKVIIETCYLTEDEKIRLCECVTAGGADYIKTSTGFGSGGAALEDIPLLAAHIGPGIRIKASGGIRTREEMERYIEAGCERIGTSSAAKLYGDRA